MYYFKNLPENPQKLADLIKIKKGHVISMSLSKKENCQMMLLAVSEGEEVTAEQYPGDTLYYVLEGTMPLVRDGITTDLAVGDIVVVPRDIPHAIGGAGDFKILQIILTD